MLRLHLQLAFLGAVILFGGCASISTPIRIAQDGEVTVRFYDEPCVAPKVLWQIDNGPLKPLRAMMKRAMVVTDQIEWDACFTTVDPITVVIDETGWIGQEYARRPLGTKDL